MQTATAIGRRNKLAGKAYATSNLIINAGGVVFYGAFSGLSFWLSAMYFAFGGAAGILLGIAFGAGGLWFAAIALQSILGWFY